MLNGMGGGAKFMSRGQPQMRKMESADEFLRNDMEEGKTSMIGDFSIRSPNIQKKRIDFGHGTTHSLDSLYIWTYTQSNQIAQKGLTF